MDLERLLHPKALCLHPTMGRWQLNVALESLLGVMGFLMALALTFIPPLPTHWTAWVPSTLIFSVASGFCLVAFLWNRGGRTEKARSLLVAGLWGGAIAGALFARSPYTAYGMMASIGYGHALAWRYHSPRMAWTLRGGALFTLLGMWVLRPQIPLAGLAAASFVGWWIDGIMVFSFKNTQFIYRELEILRNNSVGIWKSLHSLRAQHEASEQNREQAAILAIHIEEFKSKMPPPIAAAIQNTMQQSLDHMILSWENAQLRSRESLALEPPPIQSVTLQSIFDATVALAWETCQRRHVTLRRRTPAEGITLICRDVAFRHVLLWLIENAIEAIGESEDRWIELSSEILTSGQLEIRVTDSGPGITPEHQKNLFQPFFTTKEGHVGLSLMMGRRIIQASGGMLYWDNKSEKTSFVLLFGSSQQSAAETSLMD